MFIILGADGKEYGPVTTGHIAEWIRDGRANLLTKARRDDEAAWKTLGLFEEFRIGPAAAAPSLVVPMVPDTPPVLAVETAPASVWLRLAAALIDGFLKTLCFLPTTIPVTRMLLDQASKGQQLSFTEMAAATRDVLNTSLEKSLPLLACLVLVQMTLLTVRGQSVGKLLVGLRIVRLDGAPPGWLHAFLLRSCAPFLIEQIPVLGLLFWIVDSGFIFRDDHRCLHDLLAGTKVVPVRGGV
jgi:uncharacterized RDD family membrane protein YckC